MRTEESDGNPFEQEAATDAAAAEGTQESASLTPADIELAAERRIRRELLETLGRAPQPAPAAAATPAVTHPGQMPDAAADPEGFREWMRRKDAYDSDRQQRAIDQVRAESAEQISGATLWGEILADPATSELARTNQWLYRQAFLEEGGRIKGDPQEFKASIVRKVNERVAALRGAAPAASGNARTAGLSGGSAPGSAPRAARKESGDPAANAKVDLVSIIHDIRKNEPMGYYATSV